MNTFDAPGPAERDDLRADFVALGAARALLDAKRDAAKRDETVGRRVGAARLLAHARGEAADGDGRIAAALAADPGARAFYRHVVEDHALYRFPLARAAASGGVPPREVAGCRIKAIENAGRVFVIIELVDPGAEPRPRRIIVFDAAGESFEEKKLPPDLDGVFQFPLPSDSTLLRLLRDGASEVRLL